MTSTLTEADTIRALIDRWMGLDDRLRITSSFRSASQFDGAEIARVEREKAEIGRVIIAHLGRRYISHRGIEWLRDDEQNPPALARIHDAALWAGNRDESVRRERTRSRTRLLAGKEEVR